MCQADSSRWYWTLLLGVAACAPGPSRTSQDSLAPTEQAGESPIVEGSSAAVPSAPSGESSNASSSASSASSDRADPFAAPLEPVALEGPYPTLAAACAGAPPCGHTRIDPRTSEAVDAPAAPDCSAVDDPALARASGDDELRLGLVKCAVPPNLPWSEGRYHGFVRTGGSWFRTPALFTFDIGRFSPPPLQVVPACHSSARVRWEERVGHTLARFTAGVTCPACTQTSTKATSSSTVEAIVRFDTSGAAARVYPAIPTATRSERTVAKPTAACSAEQHADVPSEAWPTPDVLELGAAEVPGRALTGPVKFGISEVPASGRYHFVQGPRAVDARSPR